MVVAPFPVTLTMCVTVKANALNEERVRGTDVDVRANTGFVVAFAQYDLKTQETHLWQVVGTSSSETADVRRRRSGPLHVVSSAPLCQKAHF